MTASPALIEQVVRRRTAAADLGVRAARALLAATITLLVGVGGIPLGRAADTPAPEITLSAELLLAGNVRPGEWTAVRVHLENDGPTVDGELRIATLEQGASSYGVVVQLATGARQDHVIYGKAGFFGARLSISLVSNGAVVATVTATGTSIDSDMLGVFVIAERPERLIGDIRGSIASRRGAAVEVAAIPPEDLPPRAEAWTAVDRLVWQDVPAARLSSEQLDALTTWVALGGNLVILGGSGGSSTLDAFPDDLLPYRPERVIDVPVADLAELLVSVPADATSLPALGGALEHGAALGQSGGLVIAAHMEYGQGSVSLIGIDPTTSWLAGSAMAAALWARVMPASAPSIIAGGERSDGLLVEALSYMPSVEMPRMDHLFLLFLGYVIFLGPLNYIVLRRLDRREWAWITMPVLVVVFTAAAFVLGIVLKGTSVVVNELSVVRGAAGTDRGVANVYAGVFSPNRAAFEVRLPGGALISEPLSDQQNGDQLPLDVLLGDPARLRGFQVGYGALRGFRAETVVETPRMDADLRLVGNWLRGTVRNASTVALDHVSIAYGGGLQVLGAMAPGQVGEIDLAPDSSAAQRGLATRLFEGTPQVDAASSRTLAARIAIVRSLSRDWDWGGERASDPLSEYGPVILAWRSGSILAIDVGVAADQVGEALYLLPVRVAISGHVSFTGGTLQHSIVDINATESSDDSSAFYLGRGTMTVAYRPAGFESGFQVSGLAIRLGAQQQARPATVGEDLAALPDLAQPDQVDPVGTGTAQVPVADMLGFPRIQLFDHDALRWVEFPPTTPLLTYLIVDPERYVDASGGFLVRFVNWSASETSWFTLGVRLDGTVP